MKRKLPMAFVARTLWLLLPVAALAWHYGPGQEFFHQDLAAEKISLANQAAEKDEWSVASTNYSLASEQWPEGSLAARRRISLAEANSLIHSGNLIGGQEQLQVLITSIENEAGVDSADANASVLTSARHDLATSAYYAAWIMRLEGAETDEWLHEAELARQQFRMLAEVGSEADSDVQRIAAENLEATIRLEQMDLRTLMAKPLPKNCCSNCNGLCQKKRKQMASRCKDGEKKAEKKKGRQDVRKEIKKTNNAGLSDNDGKGS